MYSANAVINKGVLYLIVLRFKHMNSNLSRTNQYIKCLILFIWEKSLIVVFTLDKN